MRALFPTHAALTFNGGQGDCLVVSQISRPEVGDALVSTIRPIRKLTLVRDGEQIIETYADAPEIHQRRSVQRAARAQVLQDNGWRDRSGAASGLLCYWIQKYAGLEGWASDQAGQCIPLLAHALRAAHLVVIVEDRDVGDVANGYRIGELSRFAAVQAGQIPGNHAARFRAPALIGDILWYHVGDLQHGCQGALVEHRQGVGHLPVGAWREWVDLFGD